MSKLIDFVGWTGASLFILFIGFWICLAGWFGYHVKCELPKSDTVRLMFQIQTRWRGAPDIPNNAAKIAATFEHREDFHVFLRHASDGDEIVIEPRHWYWSACQPTIIIFDHGRQSK
jgi:hypothetical protein